jgi:hypothetical protein
MNREHRQVEMGEVTNSDANFKMMIFHAQETLAGGGDANRLLRWAARIYRSERAISAF